MVELRKITIDNFYSISHIEYDFKEGITNVIGLNLDNVSDNNDNKSNGAAKSSILYAISQCLFNKSFKNTDKIETTYNRVTKKPYKIRLELVSSDKFYVITNDRNTNKITISCDGDNITPKGIKNQLKLIETIVGMDFITFNSLTFMNQQTMLSILDITSDKNIIHKFFDLHKLSLLETETKSNIRDLKKDLASTTGEIIMLNKTLTEFSSYTEESIDDLYQLKNKLVNDRDSLKSSELADNIRDTNNKLTFLKDELNVLRTENTIHKSEASTIEQDLKELSSGVCPLCGSVATSTTEHKSNILLEVKAKVKESQRAVLDKRSEVEEYTNKLKELKDELQARLNSFNSEITSISNKILVSEEKNRNYRRIKDTIANLNKDLSKLQTRKETISTKLDYLVTLGTVIKSGQITQIYLDNFVKFFNSKLNELLSVVDLDFKIMAVADKGSL